MHLGCFLGRGGIHVRACEAAQHHIDNYLVSIPRHASADCRHRPSLLKYHNRHLRLGDSAAAPPGSPLASTTALSALAIAPTTRSQGWQLTELALASDAEKLELDKEIEQLERILGNEVAQWGERLTAVNRDLTTGAPPAVVIG